jgi:glycosyltransferase involved in cell wall biosynthesis
MQTQGDDADLLGLYQHAALFIYPSLYEGFGYPPFEAMTGGCPVACSNSSCFPETVANAAELFDPTSLDSIQAAVEHVLYSPSRAAELVDLGYQRIQQFSWQSTAQEHLQVYTDLVN